MMNATELQNAVMAAEGIAGVELGGNFRIKIVSGWAYLYREGDGVGFDAKRAEFRFRYELLSEINVVSALIETYSAGYRRGAKQASEGIKNSLAELLGLKRG